MDREIVLRAVTLTENAYGEGVPSLSDVKTFWARVVSNTGNENFETDRDLFRQQRIFEAWYDSAITVEHYLYYEGKDWNILDVQEIGRRNKIKIVAEVNDGK
jgi:SPP1 family predicted phage head-tail adaptor